MAIHTKIGYDQARTILGEGTMAGASLILAAPATFWACSRPEACIRTSVTWPNLRSW